MTVDMPNIRHLRAFAEVARLGSISRAAEAVHLSQPAVTHAISKLETTLSTQLFVRFPRGMKPSAAGAAYLRRADRALAYISEGAGKHPNNGPVGHDPFVANVTASQLRAILALAGAGSFSLAARNVGVSQPTIHRACRELEHLMGQPLFKSSPQGVKLTPLADRLARYAGLAAAELRQGTFEIDAMLGHDSTRIVVGSMPLVRTWFLPQAMATFLIDRPTVQISTVEGAYPNLLAELCNGRTDFLIGALRDPPPRPDIIQEPLFDDPLAIVVRKGHPLLGKPHLKLEDTRAYPWVAPAKHTPAGSYLFSTLQISSFKHTPVRVVSSSLAIVRGMLISGDYVTIVSKNQVDHELRNGTLAALPIKLANSERTIGLTYRKDWTPTPTQNKFLQTIRSTDAENRNLPPLP